MKKCPNGHSVDDNAKFCPQCGAEIVGAVCCAKCGNELKEGIKFCPKCGTPTSDIPISSDNEIDNCDVYESPTNKYKKWGIIAAIALAVVLLGGAAWYLLANKKDYSLEGLARACEKYTIEDNFYQGLALVMNGEGKYGFINKYGSEVAPCIYEIIKNPDSKKNKGRYEDGSYFDNGIAIVKRNGLYGLLDEQGVEQVPCTYQSINEFVDGYAVVENQEGRWGVMDITGKLIIPCKYEEMSNFMNGLARIKVNDKYGVIDSLGNLTAPCIYDNIYGFGDSFNAVKSGYIATRKDDCYGMLNLSGVEIVPCVYSWASTLSKTKDSNELSTVHKNGKWGAVNSSGREVIPCELSYSYVTPFSEGYAIVRNCYEIYPWGEWKQVMIPGFVESKTFYGFIDSNGREVIPLEYEDAHDFRNGIALVKKDGRWGSIDKNGRIVDSFIYNSPDELHRRDITDSDSRDRHEIEFGNGCSKVIENGVVSVVDKEGEKVVVNFPINSLDAISHYNEGVITVNDWESHPNQCGVFDKNGNTIIPYGQYDVCGPCYEGLIRVVKDYKTGFVDKSGKIVVPLIYDLLENDIISEAFNTHFSEGLAIVIKDGKQGFVDKEGNSTFDYK